MQNIAMLHPRNRPDEKGRHAGPFVLASDGDVALALAAELNELRGALDHRTGQCLEYRALALELDEALKTSETRVTELEGIVTELQGQFKTCGPDCPGDAGDYCHACGIQL